MKINETENGFLINVNDKTYCFESKESMLKFISEYYLSDAEKKELERLRGMANMQHTATVSSACGVIS